MRSNIALMGVPIEVTSCDEFVNTIINSLNAGHGGWACTVNLDILRQNYQSQTVRELLRPVTHYVADGRPLLWAAQLQGNKLPGRVCGSDLIYTLNDAAARAGRTIYLLGGNPGTAEKAAEILTQRYAGLRVVGTSCPRFGFEKNLDEMQDLISDIVASKPDIVFVGLGFPKQERLISVLRTHHPECWYLGVGISFSFVAGEVRRAPRFMQASGLEWLHRLCQEPSRLWRRYLVHDIPFFVTLMANSAAARLRPSPPPESREPQT